MVADLQGLITEKTNVSGVYVFSPGMHMFYPHMERDSDNDSLGVTRALY